MRANEVFYSTGNPIPDRPTVSMRDIAMLKDAVGGLERAEASFNYDLNMVVIKFDLDGKPGTFILQAASDGELSAKEVLRRKLIAVGRTQLGGKKPTNMTQINTLMHRGIGHRSLQILLNGLSLTGVRYENIQYGVRC